MYDCMNFSTSSLVVCECEPVKYVCVCVYVKGFKCIFLFAHKVDVVGIHIVLSYLSNKYHFVFIFVSHKQPSTYTDYHH